MRVLAADPKVPTFLKLLGVLFPLIVSMVGLVPRSASLHNACWLPLADEQVSILIRMLLNSQGVDEKARKPNKLFSPKPAYINRTMPLGRFNMPFKTAHGRLGTKMHCCAVSPTCVVPILRQAKQSMILMATHVRLAVTGLFMMSGTFTQCHFNLTTVLFFSVGPHTPRNLDDVTRLEFCHVQAAAECLAGGLTWQENNGQVALTGIAGFATIGLLLFLRLAVIAPFVVHDKYQGLTIFHQLLIHVGVVMADCHIDLAAVLEMLQKFT